MTAIFHGMVEDFMEVFMDDFLVLSDSFDRCLEGIVLGHKISGMGIEVDKAKIDESGTSEMDTRKEKTVLLPVRNHFWDEPYAFRLCPDNVMRRCVAGEEILAHCHSGPTGGHHSASVTGRKVYEAGFYWPSIFKDAKDYVMKCDACQKSGNISSQNEMPQNNI
ncbi:reverse transcriptase domain-containing protein [Tanacetum coccineum]